MHYNKEIISSFTTNDQTAHQKWKRKLPSCHCRTIYTINRRGATGGIFFKTLSFPQLSHWNHFKCAKISLNLTISAQKLQKNFARFLPFCPQQFFLLPLSPKNLMLAPPVTVEAVGPSFSDSDVVVDLWVMTDPFDDVVPAILVLCKTIGSER